MCGWCGKGRDGLRKPWLGNISLAVVSHCLWDAAAQVKAETLPVEVVCCNCLLEDKAMLIQSRLFRTNAIFSRSQAIASTTATLPLCALSQ